MKSNLLCCLLVCLLCSCGGQTTVVTQKKLPLLQLPEQPPFVLSPVHITIKSENGKTVYIMDTKNYINYETNLERLQNSLEVCKAKSDASTDYYKNLNN